VLTSNEKHSDVTTSTPSQRFWAGVEASGFNEKLAALILEAKGGDFDETSKTLDLVARAHSPGAFAQKIIDGSPYASKRDPVDGRLPRDERRALPKEHPESMATANERRAARRGEDVDDYESSEKALAVRRRIEEQHRARVRGENPDPDDGLYRLGADGGLHPAAPEPEPEPEPRPRPPPPRPQRPKPPPRQQRQDANRDPGYSYLMDHGEPAEHSRRGFMRNKSIWISTVAEADLPPSAYRVATKLAFDHAPFDRMGKAVVSQSTLADDLHITSRGAQKALNALRAAGFIDWTGKGGRRGGGGIPCTYVFLMPPK
jgi:hypothetical protein